MIRRLTGVSLLVAVLLSLAPAGLTTSGSSRQSQLSSENVDQRTWLAGLQSYAALGNWVLDKLISRLKRERQMKVAPPVTAYLNSPPFFIDAPTNLTVTAAADGQITLSWTAPPGSVTNYQVERRASVLNSFTVLNTTSGTTFPDTTVSVDHAYMYRVRAVVPGGAVSPPSNMAFGTATSFEFSDLLGKDIKAQHFYDVRTAINAVRTLANLPLATWTPRESLAGLPIEANDVQEMRDKLKDALDVLNVSVAPYADPVLSTGSNGTLIRAIHLEQLQTRSTRGSSNSSMPVTTDLSTARIDPLNQTGGGGENPLSRNYNWSVPLLNLPGRAGLDLGLSLSYNSLVWTKAGNSITFNDDAGFPSPGFRLGFPVIKGPFVNSEANKNTYLVITTDGSRIELRQIGASTSTLYESVDSSHLLLDTATMVLRTTNGTQLSYVSYEGEFNCTEIKDRNGNYITINYNPSGKIDNIHDTLDRVITFNYDNDWLSSITQTWKKTTNPAQPITHTWANFSYIEELEIQTNFNGLSVLGTSNGSKIKVLSKVTLDDNSTTPAQNSHFDFEYTPWGQIWKISNFAADNHLLNYRSYQLPGSPLWPNPPAQTDCPRFTERRDWAENWNRNGSGTEQEAITSFTAPQSGTANVPGKAAQSATFVQVTNPNGTSSKIYFLGTAGTSSGWKVGLEYLVDSYDCLDVTPTNPCSNPSLVRQVETLWTQDDETASYVLNPRVSETNAYDPSGNRRRTQIVYETFTFADNTSCRLPKLVYEYKSDASTYLRTTQISYVDHTNYAPRRIIGLVSDQRLHDGNENGTVVSWVSYAYDESGSIDAGNTPIRHDDSNYGPGFVVGRGNVTSVTRHNVSTGATISSGRKYDRAGSVISLKDPLNHEVKFGYADNFSDAISRQTFAYPKTVTDPDNFITTSSYNFDFGGVVSTQTPKPNVNYYQAGTTQTTHYDDLGRVERITNSVNTAYTRYEYSPSGNQLDVFSAMKAGASQQSGTEGQIFVITDGAGRVVASATKRASGGFNAQRFEYDVMGRRVKISNPTETSAIGSPSGWAATGADELTGWKFTQQTYDWKDRLKRTTNQDGTTRTAEYTGCGCAGGEVVTLTDEGTLVNGVNKRRQQMLHHDVLGRLIKTEVWDFEGTGPDGVSRRLHSTTVTTYNVRDQVTLVKQYAGAEGSSTVQETIMTYDGFGRLETQHMPQQQAVPNQSWTTDHTTYHYDAEDKVDYVIDARGVKKQFSYENNNRHLVTGLSYDLSALPAGQASVPATSAATFEYNAVGLRKKVTDSTGTITYTYNDLSQLTSEARVFAEFPNQTYTLNYEYEFGGQLKKITDHNNSTINYNYDTAGQLSEVTGEGNLTANVSNYASTFEYRAWGAMRSVNFGNGTSQQTSFNSRLQPTNASINGLAPGINSISWSYDYYEDGRQKHAYNGYDDRFDRLLEYDHVGRLKAVYSGREARGLPHSTPYADSPYQQSFEYDAFNNRTAKNGRFWRMPQYGATPCLPRQQSDICDSEGNLINPVDEVHVYDAASRHLKFEDWRRSVGGSPNHPELEPGVELNQTYDADGRPAKRTETRRWEELIGSGPLTNVLLTETYTYYVYSTVLGGAKVIELGGGGGHVSTTYVYANGVRIAKQNIELNSATNSVVWNHMNPGSNSFVESLSDASIRLEERDPDDAEMGTEDPWANIVEPPTYENLKDQEPLYLEGGNPFDYATGLTIDGLPVSQAEYDRRMRNGSAGAEVSAGGRPVVFVTNQQQLRHITLDVFLVDKELSNLPQSQRWGGTYYTGSFDIEIPAANGGAISFVLQKPSKTPIDPRNVPHRLLSNNEMRYLRYFFYGIVKKEECGKFLEDFLNKAAEDNPMNKLVSDEIQGIFESVASGGGFWSAPGASYNTVGGDITKNTGAIFFNNDPRFYSYGKVNRRAELAFLSTTFYGMAQTAIHEILHHAGFGDRALANTAARIQGETVTFADTWEGTLAASNYWTKLLDQHCH